MWTWNKDSDELVVTLGYGQSLVHLKSRVSWFEVPCSSLEWMRLWKWTNIFVFWWSWGESSSSCAFLSVFLRQKTHLGEESSLFTAREGGGEEGG